MNDRQWTSGQRDLVITTLAAFRGRAQDKPVVVDQLLRFIISDTRIDITPDIGARLSKWIDAELDALASTGSGMNALAEKVFQAASAARSGDDAFFDLLL